MAQARRQAAASAEREATRRVVLEKVRVVLVPDSIEGTGETPLPEDGDTLAEQEIVEAWVERGLFDGARAITAIEAYVKPGTPEQKTGEFRAPPLSNWRGAAKYVQPTLPKVERQLLD